MKIVCVKNYIKPIKNNIFKLVRSYYTISIKSLSQEAYYETMFYEN